MVGRERKWGGGGGWDGKRERERILQMLSEPILTYKQWRFDRGRFELMGSVQYGEILEKFDPNIGKSPRP